MRLPRRPMQTLLRPRTSPTRRSCPLFLRGRWPTSISCSPTSRSRSPRASSTRPGRGRAARPGPVIHVRQGQLVKITLTNNGAIPHSVDFHAARVAPDKAFGDVFPGQVGQLYLPRERSRRLHVPLRHQAGADAHRKRHVRRDRRRAEAGCPAEGRQELRPRRQRVVPGLRRVEQAGDVQHGQGARAPARLDDVQRLRRPVRQAPADGGSR